MIQACEMINYIYEEALANERTLNWESGFNSPTGPDFFTISIQCVCPLMLTIMVNISTQAFIILNTRRWVVKTPQVPPIIGKYQTPKIDLTCIPITSLNILNSSTFAVTFTTMKLHSITINFSYIFMRHLCTIWKCTYEFWNVPLREWRVTLFWEFYKNSKSVIFPHFR